jgi:class 3 adenylate cyclase
MDDPPLVAGISPARVERGFAFVDLCNFTRYTDDNGDRKAVALLAEFRAVVRAVVAGHGVRIAKWLGDGAMLVGVENEPLVEAAVHLNQVVSAQDVLPLRAGIAAGPVILFEGDDYIGNAVNLAAHLCDLAKPDQLLAPVDFLSDLMVNTRADPVGVLEIPGFVERVDVVQLREAEPVAWAHD